MNPRRKLPILSYIPIVVLLFLFTTTSSMSVLCKETPSEAINIVEQEFGEAFKLVREAEVSGADRRKIGILIDKLNLVLGLADEAKLYYSNGSLTKADEKVAQAVSLCDQVKVEAIQLRNLESQRSFYTKVFLFSLVPVEALIVTFCVLYYLRRPQRRVKQALRSVVAWKGRG